MNAKKKDPIKSLGIYCHVPFCVKKCAYCDFCSFSGQNSQTIADYFKALQQEIRSFALARFNSDVGDLAFPVVDTIYFGGGTPSSVSPEYIQKTMAVINEVFTVSEAAEKTIEINPGTLSASKAESYKAAGFNRVSVGLQVWQDELLKMLGRVHQQSDFIQCMEILRSVGFNNISVDVMYGLPGQKLEDLTATLAELMAFSPTHLSCYSLILEAGTPMTNLVKAGRLVLPSEDLEREMHWTIDRFLKAHGYSHYEISSYCRPGYESRHNLKYWEMVPYLGFGLGASGFYNGVRSVNTSDLKEYGRLIAAGKSPAKYEPPMSEGELMSEWMFLGLRKLNGIDDADFKKQFNRSFFAIYQEAIDSLLKAELLVQDGSVLRLTPKGQDFENQVSLAFF
ncbi:radical SAM family heme chaperone HemW [Acetobacterium paludosum]|uniref:Heme chaperone HemW n=1 Tax=Acetobacterium paludosum TaxID=52693 RepID=A0A923HYX5_9FIRM|nr:radical SAM family heme chaperone HemW [Acetobacterium paludosum]MBC3889164.1 radical SAM family heme chaperone HemW [Acetobacterium paludosum]